MQTNLTSATAIPVHTPVFIGWVALIVALIYFACVPTRWGACELLRRGVGAQVKAIAGGLGALGVCTSGLYIWIIGPGGTLHSDDWSDFFGALGLVALLIGVDTTARCRSLAQSARDARTQAEAADDDTGGGA